MIRRMVVIIFDILLLFVLIVAGYFIVAEQAMAPLTVTIAEVRRIDNSAFRLVARAGLSEEDAFSFYDTLFRLEAEYVSRADTGAGVLQGSIMPIAHHIACARMPDDCVFMWHTLDDYRAEADIEVAAVTDEIVMSGISFMAPEVSLLSLSLSEVDWDSEAEGYKAILLERTLDRERAAAFWREGEGTRRAPGVLAELIGDYLTLDTTRDARAFVEERAAMFARAHMAYQAAQELVASAHYQSPIEGGEVVPRMVAAVHAAAPRLRALLPTQGKKDLDAEVKGVDDAFYWSGGYYAAAVQAAQQIGDHYAKQQ